MTSRTSGAARVALAAATWGLWPLFVRGSPVPSAWLAVSALGIFGVLALPFALRRRGAPRPASAWLLVAALGGGDALNNRFYFTALGAGPVAPAVVSHYLAPVLVAVAAPFVLRERFSKRTLVAVVLGLGGTTLLVAGKGGGAGASAAVAWGAGSAVFYAATVLGSKPALARFSVAEVGSYHALVGAALLALAAPWPPPPLADFARPALGALACAVGGSLLFYSGLKRLTAATASILTYLEIVSATAVGVFAFHESVGALAAAGAVLVFAAGVVVLSAHQLNAAPATPVRQREGPDEPNV